MNSLHNSIFFDFPWNYVNDNEDSMGNDISEVADNKYHTFSSEGTIKSLIHDENSEATKFTHVFIKSKNLVSVTLTPEGNNHSIPVEAIEIDEEVVKWEGSKRSIIDRGGYQNILLDFSSEQNLSTNITFGFTTKSGVMVEIYEIMVLNSIMQLRANGNYTKIISRFQDRSGVIHEDIEGGLSRAPGINKTRIKRGVDYTAYFVRKDSYDNLIHFLENYQNFVFSREYSRHPDEVYPAIFPDLEHQIENIGRRKTSGDKVDFRISES